jgi:hypothetical protein
VPERARTTIALERRSFADGGDGLAVVVDRERDEADLRPTETMIVVELPVGDNRHRLRLIEQTRA